MVINLDFVLNDVQGKLLSKDSPIALPKSVKNPTEIDGMKRAHVSIIYIDLFNNQSEVSLFLNVKS